MDVKLLRADISDAKEMQNMAICERTIMIFPNFSNQEVINDIFILEQIRSFYDKSIFCAPCTA